MPSAIPPTPTRLLPSSLLPLLVAGGENINAAEGMNVETTIDDIDLGMDMDMGSYLLRVIWVLGGLSTALLGLRLYSKIWRRRPLWCDDWVLVAAWVRFCLSIFSLFFSPPPRSSLLFLVFFFLWFLYIAIL
jgi:hypothetical protein